MNKIGFLRGVDKYCGNVLIAFLSVFNLKKKKLSGKKVLIIRLWTLGESLLTLPLIEKLKEEGFDVTVLVSSRSKSVFENKGYKVLDVKQSLKFFKAFDIVIDTEPYFRVSAILSKYLGKTTIGFGNLFRAKLYDFKIKYDDKTHSVINFCRLLEPLGLEYKPDSLVPLNYTEKDKETVDSLLTEFNLVNKKIIGIHAGTAETAPWRSWKKEKFAKLIDFLTKDGFHIVLTGSKSDAKVNKDIVDKVLNKERVFDFSGKTNLSELAYLMTKFKVFISNDTGPMHLSAAMRTKTIGLFGPNLPERFAPFGRGNVGIYKASNLECSPCINVHKGEFKKCKLNGKCMELIEVEDVYNNVLKLVRL
ncbi:MAG: heptosyltransferase [Candidatus Woesearchaeota archaeon]|nr:heptosyltransferase [Candidatus Woesearchaeota archaeon]